MVALLTRLKLTLWRRSLVASKWRLVGVIAGSAYGLGVLALWWFGVFAFGGSAPTLHLVGVLGMAVIGLTWLFGSLVFFGTDETLDPARFALLPVPARKLMPGLLIGGLIGLPGIFTLLFALVLPVAWARHGVVPAMASAVSIVLGVALTFLMVRALTAGLSAMLASRRFRDLAAVLVGVIAISAGLLINLATSAGQALGASWPGYRIAADVLAWTPFGAPWAIPGELAAGRGVMAAALVAASLVWFALLWAWWRRMLENALVSPGADATGSARAAGGRGIERLLGTGPAGAIAVRGIRYWRRDPRYLTSLVNFPLMPLVVASPALMAGGEVSIPVRFIISLMAMMFGVTLAADISYDSTALWVHIVSGVRGVDDRRGRVMAATIVIGPILAVLLVAAALIDGPARLAGTAALLIVFALGSAGVGSYVGSVLQGVVPQPGENAFARGGGSGFVNILIMLITVVGSLLVGAPTLLLVILGDGRLLFDVLALVSALVMGVAAYLLGTSLGGRRLDARWPEALRSISPA